MSRWSRRQVLQALGVGAAAPTIGPFLTACGGRGARARRPTRGPRRIESLRAELRERVGELSREYLDVTALATVSIRGGAAADGHERGADTHRETSLVFGLTAGSERHEQATTDISSAGIDRTLAMLRSRVDADPRAEQVDLAAPVDHAIPLARDPAAQPPRVWLRDVDSLLARAQRVGGSRIVYRGAYVTVDDATTLFLGRGRDRSQRVVRTRSGLLLVAWTGSSPTADQAGRAGTIGLEALTLPTEELDDAATRALSLLTARAVPEGPAAIVLAPDVTAMLVGDGLAPMLCAAAWHDRRVPGRLGHILGSSEIGLVDDPTLAGGYGSYFFDDEGTPAAPVTLVEGGSVAAAYTDRATARALRLRASGHGRRAQAHRPVGPVPSNLSLSVGSRPLDQLYAAVGQGLLVQGARAVRVDPSTGRVVIRATRALGIRGGKLDGAVYGAVELRAKLDDLLGAAVASDTLGPRRPHAIAGLAVSAAGPHLATRAEVRRG